MFFYPWAGDIVYSVWYKDHSRYQTEEVGKLKANALRLYDMSGNIAEWCWDWHDSIGTGTATDPQGGSSGTGRVFRGGSYNNDADYCAVATRLYASPWTAGTVGFRVVCRP
jgi:formylglycine-generating enzyme required for sulfatase activity